MIYRGHLVVKGNAIRALCRRLYSATQIHGYYLKYVDLTSGYLEKTDNYNLHRNYQSSAAVIPISLLDSVPPFLGLAWIP